MHITIEEFSAQHRIQAYGPEGILVADSLHTDVLMISAETVITDWTGPAPAALDEASLGPMLEQDPEIIVIGTGVSTIALPEGLAIPLQSRGIGLEVMATGPACRTFNILLSEHRRVVALLYPE